MCRRACTARKVYVLQGRCMLLTGRRQSSTAERYALQRSGLHSDARMLSISWCAGLKEGTVVRGLVLASEAVPAFHSAKDGGVPLSLKASLGGAVAGRPGDSPTETAPSAAAVSSATATPPVPSVGDQVNNAGKRSPFCLFNRSNCSITGRGCSLLCDTILMQLSTLLFPSELGNSKYSQSSTRGTPYTRYDLTWGAICAFEVLLLV